MSYLLNPKDIEEVNGWFDELKLALGLSLKADRGRVLASVRKREEEREKSEADQQLVANYMSYKFWGDLVAAAGKAGEELVVAVELSREFLEVPTGWVLGTGKPTYDKAKKHLPQTQALVKKVFAYLEGKREEWTDESIEQEKKSVTDAFLESEGWEQLNQSLWEYYREVPEPLDPAEVWLEAADQCRTTLERSRELPPIVVTELLDYAEAEGVEITKKEADWVRKSDYAERLWFNYLICAYLTKERRPDDKLFLEVKEKVLEAAKLGELCATNRENPSIKVGERVWDKKATLGELEMAYVAYKDAAAEENFRSFTASQPTVKDKVMAALGKGLAEKTH